MAKRKNGQNKKNVATDQKAENLRGRKIPLTPETEKIVQLIETDLDVTSQAQFAIGDRLIELLRILNNTNIGRKVTLKDVRSWYFPTRHYSVLSMCLRVAGAFETTERRAAAALGATFRECFDAQAQHRRLIKTKSIPADAPVLPLVTQIQRQRHKSCTPKQIVRAVVEDAKDKIRKDAEEKAAIYLKFRPPGSWTDQFRQERFQDTIAADLIKPKSLALGWFDPPYLYSQPGGPRAVVSGGGSPLDDKGVVYDHAGTLQTYIDGIRLYGDRELLLNRGCLVVCSAGGELDEPEVVLELRKHFKYLYPLYWRKPTSAGAQYKLFGCSTERIVIAAKSRDALLDMHAGTARSQELQLNLDQFKSPTRKAVAKFSAGKGIAGETSIYEKPVDLCEYLLDKLTLPGDLVHDMCGNRATMVEACIRMNRRWLYNEIDPGNFGMGLDRIRRLMGESNNEAA